ncbi:hypothetical protein GCU67_03580 [Modestobacter muralis]|uniref:DUF5667 domain-containing protein n=1 Tax=Modestobacter muralis TaxID=1608614 RepID=A0A6P0ENS0_9ACTN|nr:hypothetical protein [Modestobacter muralis]NEK93262.1 hypothetical protein [Modestobacter muralis]NEN50029.1 hypothetical protein [Modestobacter muralis]
MTVQQSDPAPGSSRRGSAAEDALLARLEALGTDHAVVPDEAFRAVTRERLVAMAAVRTPEPAPNGTLRRWLASSGERPRRRSRLTAGVAGAALTLAALGGLLGAAQGARPGDLLYDVKRGGEQTRLSLAGHGDRGLTLLGLATTRLQEAGELVGVSVSASAAGGEAGLAAGADAGLLVDTLTTMDAQTTQGTADLTAAAVEQDDAAALEVLVGWAGRQRTGLTELSPAVPPGAEDAVTAAGRLVEQVAARGAALQEALACPAGPATGGADALGPLPAPCAPVTPPAAPPGTAPVTTSAASGAPAAPRTTLSASPRGSTAAPAPGSGQPRATRPTLPTPGTAVPRPTARAPRPALPTPTLPRLPVPSLPVPSVSLPPAPGAPAPPAAPSSSAGAAVELPPVVPGLRVCLPPVVTVDCRPSGG